MIQIVIYNSTCNIAGLSTTIYRELESYLSYNDQQADYQFHKVMKQLKRVNAFLSNKSFKSDEKQLLQQRAILSKQLKELDAQRKISLLRSNEFPSGLLPRTLDWLIERKLEYKLVDKRVEPKKNSVKLQTKVPFPDLRHYQKAAIKKLIDDGRGVVVLPTGTGKTVTAAKMLWSLGVKTLIVTPSKSITDMMEQVMTKFFGSGSVEVLNTKTVKLKKAISVCNIQSLVKIAPGVFKDVDCVVIDEFHHSAAETYQEVNLNHLKNVFYRIGLTATNFRNDGADIALEGVLSEVLYEYPVQTAIEEGYLTKPRFEIVPMPMELSASNYQKAYKEGIVLNEQRNHTIAEIASEHKNQKMLILVQHKEHGEKLKELIQWADFIHGEEKDDVRQKMLKDFETGKLNCLIGTSVIGEGVDLPSAEVLIMAGGGKARSQIIQNIGRVLRIKPGKKEALIYDFDDQDDGYLQDHSEARQEIYTEYDVK
jgi:superfamily II DNA or RNA helicase